MPINTVQEMKEALCEKLKLNFGSTVEEASDAQMMRACAMVLRDVMAERSVETKRKTREKHERQVHYLSMEFLMGRSLMKNAYNLGVSKVLSQALDELGCGAIATVQGRRSRRQAIPSAMSWVFSVSVSWTASRSSCRTSGRRSAARG